MTRLYQKETENLKSSINFNAIKPLLNLYTCIRTLEELVFLDDAYETTPVFLK